MALGCQRDGATNLGTVASMLLYIVYYDGAAYHWAAILGRFRLGSFPCKTSSGKGAVPNLKYLSVFLITWCSSLKENGLQRKWCYEEAWLCGSQCGLVGGGLCRFICAQATPSG